MKLFFLAISALFHGVSASNVDTDLLSYHHQPLHGRTLVEVTSDNPNLSTITHAKLSTDFAGLLSSVGNFTFFAPDNDAFGYLHTETPELAEALSTEPWIHHLRNLLAFHVIEDEAIFSTNVHESTAVETLNGDPLHLTNYQGQLWVWPTLHGGYARVVTPDNGSDNGVAHFVDSILLARWLTSSLMDSTTKIEDVFTFKQLLVASGLAPQVAHGFGYTVSHTGIPCRCFETEVLLSHNTKQVLAPSNRAFARIDRATMAYLESSEGEKDLVDLLTNHIVPKVLPSTLLKSSDDISVQTKYGSELSFDYVEGDVFKINGATVLTFDVLASNGILHVIDSVLVPAYVAENKEGHDGSTDPPRIEEAMASSGHDYENARGEFESRHVESPIEFEPGSGDRSGIEPRRIDETGNYVMVKQQMHLRRRNSVTQMGQN